MKRVKVALDESTLERLRDVARRKAVVLRADISWLWCIRDAVERYLAEETVPQLAGRPDAGASRGAR